MLALGGFLIAALKGQVISSLTDKNGPLFGEWAVVIWSGPGSFYV